MPQLAVRLSAAQSPIPSTFRLLAFLHRLCFPHCWVEARQILPHHQRCQPQLSLTRSPLQGLQAAIAALAPAAAMSASEQETAVAAFFRSGPPSEPCLPSAG